MDLPNVSGDFGRASMPIGEASQMNAAARSSQQAIMPTVSHLTDELTKRLNISDQAQKLVPVFTQGRFGVLWPPTVYFCELRHNFRVSGDGESENPEEGESLVSRWRSGKDRLKTVAVALVLCLNIGVDPPDVIKISPCARLECWVDPLSQQPAKALETIGKNLQAQYERWQPRAKYRMHLDPTMDDVKKLAISCRKAAKAERVLFHYNGHGVPRPTTNGEIWVFNKSFTQYIPLSIYDLQSWVGLPAIYVFDCSAAGVVVKWFRKFAAQRADEERAAMAEGMGGGPLPPHLAQEVPRLENPMRGAILLAACGELELLPQNPDLPADVFTACLTTPIKVALRWFTSRSLLRSEGLNKELIDRIPGKQTDRKTPLGELNWIFTAITDTIAWNCLPRALFQRLFRQDLVVASLFRNFLLAERILKAANCSPLSYPRLPPTHQHPMWQAWDLAAELLLLQLPALLQEGSKVEFQPSPFFSEQLTAFELWLEHGSREKRPPEQLPIVLQVLLSQVHRLRALVLLGRLLDMGAWAVDLALSVGIFPYVLKLLQTTAIDLRHTLVFIWTKILALDRECQQDLVKDNGYIYFIRYLESGDPGILPDSRAQAAFVLATVCEAGVKGQALCMAANLVGVLCSRLKGAVMGGEREPASSALLTRWLCLCLGQLIRDLPEAVYAAREAQAPLYVTKLLSSAHPEVRAAAVFALGCFILVQERLLPPEVVRADGYANGAMPGLMPMGHPPPGMPHPMVVPPPVPLLNPAQLNVLPETERQVLERDMGSLLMPMTQDASPLVRSEVAVALARLAAAHSVYFEEAISAQQHKEACALQRPASEKWQGESATAAAGPGVPKGGSAHSAPTEGPVGQGVQLPPRQSGSFQEKGSLPLSSSPPLSGELAHSPLQPLSGPTLGTGGRPGTPPTGSFGAPLRGGQPGSVIGEAGSRTPGADSVLSTPGTGEATRIGGGIYENLLSAACQLALDPFPQVEALGAAALRVLGASLVPIPAATGGEGGAGEGGSGAVGIAGRSTPIRTTLTAPARMNPATPSSSVGSLWNRSNLWGSRSASPAGVPFDSLSSGRPDRGDTGGPSQSRPPNTFRLPYMLVRMDRANPSSYGGRSTPGDPQDDNHRPPGGPPSQDGNQGGEAAEALPQSPAYKASCRYFCHPLLDPQATVWRQTQWSAEVGTSPAFTAVYDPSRVSQRVREREELVSRLQSLPKEAGIRLKEDGITELKMHAPLLVGLLLHPFRPLVTVADPRGFVRSYNYHHPPHAHSDHHPVANEFHVLNGHGRPSAQASEDGRSVRPASKMSAASASASKAPAGTSTGRSAKDLGSRGDQGAAHGRITHKEAPTAHIVNMFHINETHAGVLVAGLADGSVYVWRNYTSAHNQRLATAWRAVEVGGSAAAWQECRPATFEWSDVENAGRLYAAGGASPSRIYAWDATSETCALELDAEAPAAGAASVRPPGISFLRASRRQQLLVAACDNGLLQLFDLRAQPTPVASTRPPNHDTSKIVGMVLEPGGEENKLVTGVSKGWVQFVDFRKMRDAVDGAAYEMGTWKTFDAVKTGSLSSISGHPHAPLIATGTTDQVVRLWNPHGEKLSSMRISTKLMASRIGPITQLAFHPYRLLLAGGGQDRLLTIYAMSSGMSSFPEASSVHDGVSFSTRTVSESSMSTGGGSEAGRGARPPPDPSSLARHTSLFS